MPRSGPGRPGRHGSSRTGRGHRRLRPVAAPAGGGNDPALIQAQSGYRATANAAPDWPSQVRDDQAHTPTGRAGPAQAGPARPERGKGPGPDVFGQARRAYPNTSGPGPARPDPRRPPEAAPAKAVCSVG